MKSRPILLITVDERLSQEAAERLKSSLQGAAKDEYLVLISDKDINPEVTIITDDNLHFHPNDQDFPEIQVTDKEAAKDWLHGHVQAPFNGRMYTAKEVYDLLAEYRDAIICDHDWYEPCGALVWNCRKCGATDA